MTLAKDWKDGVLSIIMRGMSKNFSDQVSPTRFWLRRDFSAANMKYFEFKSFDWLFIIPCWVILATTVGFNAPYR